MKIAGIYAIFLLLILAGCTETTTIGGEILNQDQAALQAIDTLTIRTATVTEDSLVVYDINTTGATGTYLCGHFEDPTFGTVKADFYAQFRVNENALPSFPDTAMFDSLVLFLEYDLAGIYGDSLAEHEFEIYRIRDMNADTSVTYFSGDELMTDELLETIRFKPDFEAKFDSTIVVSIDSTVTPSDTTYATIDPFFSIRLDDLIDDLVEINTNSLDQDNEVFLENFGGLAIRPVGGPTGSMLSFDIGALETGLQLHYHTIADDATRTERIYEYNITTFSVRFSSFESEQNADIVTAEAGGFEAGKTQTYIQGMDGPSTLIQLPFIDDFKDQVLVNNAELVVTIQPDLDVDLYPLVTQLNVLYKTDEGDFVTIEDLLLTANGVGIVAFGGRPESFTGTNGETLMRYRMQIAGHLQRMIDEELPNEIYLQVLQKNERANRVILYGAEHPQYPVTLNARFTDLN